MPLLSLTTPSSNLLFLTPGPAFPHAPYIAGFTPSLLLPPTTQLFTIFALTPLPLILPLSPTTPQIILRLPLTPFSFLLLLFHSPPSSWTASPPTSPLSSTLTRTYLLYFTHFLPLVVSSTPPSLLFILFHHSFMTAN